MSERRSRLAARFRKAVKQEEEAREQNEAESQRALQQAREARDALLGDLEALAQEMGFLKVNRAREGLTLRYQERYLHFAPHGDGEVKVDFDATGDDEHRLYRQEELGNRWVYLRKRRFREDRVPFFDQGIEELLVMALGLPRPGEGVDDDDDRARNL